MANEVKVSCLNVGNTMPEYEIKQEDITVMFKSLGKATNQSTDQTDQSTNQTGEKDISVRIL